MHIPPKGLAPHIETSHPDEEALFSLLEKYRGVTCFFGDYHGHWRGERNGVSYIITGGGGRLKSWQSEWGKFNHILRISVAQDRISEEMITLRRHIGLEDRFEEKVFTHLFPVIQNFFWILDVIFVLLSIGSGYSLVKLIKTVREHKIPGARKLT
jgi:hypothetical protein